MKEQPESVLNKNPVILRTTQDPGAGNRSAVAADWGAIESSRRIQVDVSGTAIGRIFKATAPG
jgi:hypothetical protein